MSDSAQATQSAISDRCLCVLISTHRHYVNIDVARQHLRFFLANYIDEPVTLLYCKKDANALSIAKAAGYKRMYSVSENDIKKLNKNNTIVLLYHQGLAKGDTSFSEILCRTFQSFYTFDTNLRVDYGKSCTS